MRRPSAWCATCAGSAGASYAPAAWEEATTLDLGGGAAPLPWVTSAGALCGRRARRHDDGSSWRRCRRRRRARACSTFAAARARSPPRSAPAAAAARCGSTCSTPTPSRCTRRGATSPTPRRTCSPTASRRCRGGRFDWIVSNPPVHNGLQTDFKVLRLLVRGAARRLRSGGELFVVVQTYVPLGAMLAAQPKLEDVRTLSDDGRFSVWAARKKAKGGGGGEGEGERWGRGSASRVAISSARLLRANGFRPRTPTSKLLTWPAAARKCGPPSAKRPSCRLRWRSEHGAHRGGRRRGAVAESRAACTGGKHPVAAAAQRAARAAPPALALRQLVARVRAAFALLVSASSRGDRT